MMKSRDIAHLRLISQHLTGSQNLGLTQLVRWMGCVQAQDYGMAKWALGCRLPDTTEAGIEKEFSEGKILRTHVLRPTWHFICPEDIHWMLKLSAPKIKALTRPYHQKLGIDNAILKKSKILLTRALEEHGALTRPQIAELLRKGKIATDETRLGHLLMDAELDAIICSAGRMGKQFAYGLLGAQATKLGKEESLAELAGRYFLSRGPATVHDFAWWAGLTLTEARKGLDAIRASLTSQEVNGYAYWFPPAAKSRPPDGTHLLPAFDEYTVGYKNRDDVLDPARAANCSFGLKPIVVHNARIVGVWRRSAKKGKAMVEIMPFPGEKPVPALALAAAVKKYERFMGR
jgi:hypothetical protein